MIVGAIAANYPALLSGVIVDHVSLSDPASFANAVPYLGLLLASYLVREIAAAIRKYLVEGTACAIERDELRRLSGFLLRLDLSAFLGQRIGGLNVRVHRDLEGLIKLLKLLFLDLFPTLVVSLVAFYFVAQRSLLVCGVMALTFALALAATIVQVITQNGIRISLFSAKEEVSANLTEVMLGLDYVRAAGGIEQEEARTTELSERMRAQEFRHHKWMMSFDAFKQILEGVGLVVVIGLGAWQMALGHMSKGDVLTLALLYASVAAPLRDLHRIIDEGFEGLLKVAELAGLYSLPADTGIPGSRAVTASRAAQAIMKAEGVGFTVTNADGEELTLLKNVNLSVQAGEWVGIAGGSGSAKTTLLKIILGIAPRYDGHLAVFGTEIRDALKADYWRQIGYVGQRSHIIKGTLRENLTYGSVGDDLPDDELLAALGSAGLSERFAQRGPECLFDHIEEQGRNLSGGEQQRLAIARVFLRKPTLIIMDEATSALDYENEWKLVQGLRTHFRNVTALVVAHRLEALRETDRIVVMKSGEVVQEGSFAALCTTEGEFRKIANLIAIPNGPDGSA
jgi:ATP-binding cassette subfamily B protein